MLDSLLLWCILEDVISLANDRLGGNFLQMFPTAENFKGDFEVALFVPNEQNDSFEKIVPSIAKEIQARNNYLRATFLDAVPVSPEEHKVWSDDQGKLFLGGIEVEDMFTSPN